VVGCFWYKSTICHELLPPLTTTQEEIARQYLAGGVLSENNREGGMPIEKERRKSGARGRYCLGGVMGGFLGSTASGSHQGKAKLSLTNPFRKELANG